MRLMNKTGLCKECRSVCPRCSGPKSPAGHGKVCYSCESKQRWENNPEMRIAVSTRSFSREQRDAASLRMSALRRSGVIPTAPFDEDHRKALSSSLVIRWQDPEFRQRQAQALSDTHRAKSGGVLVKDSHYARMSDPSYIRWRRGVLARDRYQCRFCATGKRLEAAHRIPYCIAQLFPFLRYSLDNGITLCIICHALFDSNRAQFLTPPDKKKLKQYDSIVMMDTSVIPYRPIFVKDWPTYCKAKQLEREKECLN